jgi:hypothetical protein
MKLLGFQVMPDLLIPPGGQQSTPEFGFAQNIRAAVASKQPTSHDSAGSAYSDYSSWRLQ